MRIPSFAKPLAIGAVAIVILTPIIVWALTPKEHFTSVRQVKVQADKLDGQTVHLRGTVGQIFPVGGGYAFYLHQGQDTIVVFTRGRTPTERDRIKLYGTVSTGYLGGVPRAAVFETDTPVK